MLQYATNVKQRHLAQSRVFLAGKQRLAPLPQTLVRVHARTVVAIQRLGHEGRRLAVPPRDVFDDVFVEHHVVGRLDQGVKPKVNFSLAAGSHFVMLALDLRCRVAP